MTGYTGVGGDINGIRNPVLRAKKGERVKITLINGELMAHDIVMEALDLRSEPVVEEGDTAVIVFEALENDVYRSEEHTSELQSLMRISYAVFCLKKKKIK